MVGRRLLGRSAVLLIVAASLVGGAGVGAPARAETFQVIWPEITAFNPETTDYVVEVEYDGDGYLFVGGGGWPGGGPGFVSPLPPNGPFEVPFAVPVATSEYILQIFRCPTSDPWTGDCQRLATKSPLALFSVFRTELRPFHHLGPAEPISFASVQPRPGKPLDVAWTVLPRTGDDRSPILTGTAEDVPSDGSFSLSDPLGKLPIDTDLILKVEVVGEAAPYGVLSGRTWTQFRWDPENEVALELETSFGWRTTYDVPVFYPVADGHADRLGIRAVDDVVDSGRLAVENRVGRVVFAQQWPRSGPYPGALWWDGRDAGGDLLPEGRYRVVLSSSDWAGNVGVAEAHVRLSHQRLESRTLRATLTPQETLLSERTGECGWIQRDTVPAWEGSLGLYTAERCPGGGFRFAHTVHRIPLPHAASFSPSADVELWAKGRKASGGQVSELDVRFREAGSSPTRWGQWDTAIGPTTWRDVDVLGDRTRNARILLAASTLHGRRVDLKNIKVTWSYIAFVD